MWNSYPPTEEDMIVAENWLFRKGVTPLMHACAYVFDSTSPLIGA